MPPRAAASKEKAAPKAEKATLSLRGDKEETVPTGEGMPLTLEVDPRRGPAAATAAPVTILRTPPTIQSRRGARHP